MLSYYDSRRASKLVGWLHGASALVQLVLVVRVIRVVECSLVVVWSRIWRASTVHGGGNRLVILTLRLIELYH